jgi:hypothetical protein
VPHLDDCNCLRKNVLAPRNNILVHPSQKRLLSASQICERLRGDGCAVAISHDAGRFVCNWCYYNSLALNETRARVESLFVHVPPFEVCNAHAGQAPLIPLQRLGLGLGMVHNLQLWGASEPGLEHGTNMCVALVMGRSLERKSSCRLRGD